jgi:Mor family transcriptional regulator
VTRRGDDRLAAFVDAMVRIGAAELTRTLDTEEQIAREVMRAIAHELCNAFASQYIYIPLDRGYALGMRDREIWAKYRADSAHARKYSPARVAELAAEYSLTTVQVYCIVRLMRERERAARGPVPETA